MGFFLPLVSHQTTPEAVAQGSEDSLHEGAISPEARPQLDSRSMSPCSHVPVAGERPFQSGTVSPAGSRCSRQAWAELERREASWQVWGHRVLSLEDQTWPLVPARLVSSIPRPPPSSSETHAEKGCHRTSGCRELWGSVWFPAVAQRSEGSRVPSVPWKTPAHGCPHRPPTPPEPTRLQPSRERAG